MWRWFSGPLGLWSDRALSHLHLHLVFTCAPGVNIEILGGSNHAQVHDVIAWRVCGRKYPISPEHLCQKEKHSKHSHAVTQSLAVINSVVCFSSSSFNGGQYEMEDKVVLLFFYRYLFLAVQHLPPLDHLCQRFARLHHHPFLICFEVYLHPNFHEIKLYPDAVRLQKNTV